MANRRASDSGKAVMKAAAREEDKIPPVTNDGVVILPYHQYLQDSLASVSADTLDGFVDGVTPPGYASLSSMCPHDGKFIPFRMRILPGENRAASIPWTVLNPLGGTESAWEHSCWLPVWYPLV
jgi:hypothetical protein